MLRLKNKGQGSAERAQTVDTLNNKGHGSAECAQVMNMAKNVQSTTQPKQFLASNTRGVATLRFGNNNDSARGKRNRLINKNKETEGQKGKGVYQDGYNKQVTEYGSDIHPGGTAEGKLQVKVTTPYVQCQADSNYTQHRTEDVPVRGEGQATTWNLTPLNAQRNTFLTFPFGSGSNNVNSNPIYNVNQSGRSQLMNWNHNMTQRNMLNDDFMVPSVEQVFNAQCLREQEQECILYQSGMVQEPFQGGIVSQVELQKQAEGILQNLLNGNCKSEEHFRRDMCASLYCTGHVEDLYRLLSCHFQTGIVPQRSFMEVIMGMLRHQMAKVMEGSDQITRLQQAQTMPVLYLIIYGVLMLAYGATVYERQIGVKW